MAKKRGATPEPAPDKPVPEAKRYQKNLKPTEFFPAIASYTDQTATALYCYRVWPKIDRGQAGSTVNYIDKVSEPVTEDWLKKHWGSGIFQLRWCDSNNKRHEVEVYRTVVKIDDADYPPVVDDRELLLDHPDNRSFVAKLRARGKLPKEEGEHVDSGNATATAAINAVKEMAIQSKRAGEGSNVDVALKVVEMMQKSSGHSPSTKELLEIMKLAGGDGQQTTALIKGLLDQQTKMMELINKNPDQSFGRFNELFDFLGNFGVRFDKGGGPAAETSWVRDLIQVAPGLIQMWFSMKGAQAPVPAPAAPDSRPAVEAAPAAQPEPNPAGLGELTALLTEIIPRALAAFQRGVSGDDFAHALCTMYPDGETILNMLSAAGQDGLLAQLRALPVWPSFADREMALAAWLHEFLTYGVEEPEGVPA